MPPGALMLPLGLPEALLVAVPPSRCRDVGVEERFPVGIGVGVPGRRPLAVACCPSEAEGDAVPALSSEGVEVLLTRGAVTEALPLAGAVGVPCALMDGEGEALPVPAPGDALGCGDEDEEGVVLPLPVVVREEMEVGEARGDLVELEEPLGLRVLGGEKEGALGVRVGGVDTLGDRVSCAVVVPSRLRRLVGVPGAAGDGEGEAVSLQLCVADGEGVVVRVGKRTVLGVALAVGGAFVGVGVALPRRGLEVGIEGVGVKGAEALPVPPPPPLAVGSGEKVAEPVCERDAARVKEPPRGDVDRVAANLREGDREAEGEIDGTGGLEALEDELLLFLPLSLP